MTTPGTAVAPGPVSVKVNASIVAGVIASLKVAVSAWLVGTAVAPLTGTVEMTAGGAVAGSVRKLQT